MTTEAIRGSRVAAKVREANAKFLEGEAANIESENPSNRPVSGGVHLSVARQST